MRGALLLVLGMAALAASAAEPAARPASTVPEPSSGLPPGRLVPLPVMTDTALRDLASDLALHLEVTGGYRRLKPDEAAALPALPAPVSPGVAIARDHGAARDVMRIGYLVAPRRLPQLWIQAYTVQGGHAAPAGGDTEPAKVDAALRELIAERAKLDARLRIADLETRTIPLSYVDAEAALFALRAMGYAVVTDSEPLANDDSYRGQDVDAYELARNAAQVAMPATAAAEAKGKGDDDKPATPPTPQQVAMAAIAAMPADEQKRFLPRFPAIRNLPTTIALDRLPMIVKMPSTDSRNMGLVGGELAPAQRDQSGLTVIPSAASPLAETVTGGSSDLLVIYHPEHPEQLARLQKLIDEKIDRPARQVFVEGLVLEISQEGLKELGVQWDLKKGNQAFSIGSLVPPAAGVNALSFTRDSTLNISPSIVTARINALVQSNKAEILSRPSLITLDNRQATIRVGTDIPVATSKDAGGAGSGSSRVAFSFQYIPTGILLNVRPRISDDLSEISMLIDATVSSTVPGQDLQVLDPATKIALASAPTIATRRVQTYARILDNQPLIIGGLLSRNRIKTTGRVPLLGDIPVVGALFGTTHTEDDRREVIIVLTPSVVTENIRETKAQYPKDDPRFDVYDTALFKEHHRIRAEDLVDSSDIRFNARFRAYRDIANKVIEREPALANRRPFADFAGNKVPGEFFFVTGMMYRMLDRLNAGEPILVSNMKFFERNSETEMRPVSVSQVLARYGDGATPESFFARNPGKALALTFTLGRSSMDPSDMYSETTPEVAVVDCPDRATWRQLLWDMSRPDSRGVPRYTILLHDESDLRRLKLAYATQNTVLNNGGVGGMVFDRFLVGRMLHLQEVSPTWERILNAQIAQYFFVGEHYYMYFVQEHQAAMQKLEAALRAPEMKPLLQGIALP